MDKHYFMIKTTDDEYSSSYKRICESLEEAKSHIMEYADWYCSNGSCTIIEVDKHFNTCQRWRYLGGRLVRHSSY